MEMVKGINAIFKLGFLILMWANINAMTIEYPTMVGYLIFPYIMGCTVCVIGFLWELTRFDFDFSPLDPNQNLLVFSGGAFTSVVYFIIR